MAELTQVQNDTPLPTLALHEASAIITATLKRFEESGNLPEITRLLMTVATSCYVSGINSGVHMALLDGYLAEALVRQNTTDEDFNTARAAATRFLQDNEGVLDGNRAAVNAGAGPGAPGLR